jgi:hypothetical protein
MPSCNLRPPPVHPHGSQNHYAHQTFKQLHSQAIENSKHDNAVHHLHREKVKNYTVHPNNITSYMGGCKHIECPLTNKNHSINSKAGKQIISTYKKHLLSKKEKNCSFTTIKNPATNRYVSIYGKIGRNIINNYK